MRKLTEELKRLKGQPVEIITESGFKFCGIDAESDEDSVLLIDDKGRPVLIVNNHIDAIIEPQMKLKRVCGDDDCDCRNNRENDDDRSRRDRNCD